ncbi:PIG-P-domain-containing protein [Mytilinidion resinicola]|uniref:PIG-P-domain-containing protein n=1 Tax=Mytilinidion resinicola TaxID=574789 RepID=A0A6A6Y1Q1_9PEZI|nr:PIG-P-domain-containing protein [Mytilinidion resinicola]KAF2802580.1 PIG-P-domain-containing protein [Mytilinidion resinicola]
MAPHSRGNAVPAGFQSKSTPNLPTLHSLEMTPASRSALASPENQAPPGGPLVSPTITTSPSEPLSEPPSVPASVEDNDEEEEDDNLFGMNPSDSDSDSDTNPAPASRPLYTSRSHTHLPPHTVSSLFPPFYNRPPTPLPPSPSLTSLLRPSFSTQTSRPTTPDSSDVDITTTPNSSATLARLTTSARAAPTVPRASPKVPTYEYYGFALYLASSAAFCMYILWAYLPSPFLHQLGIHYYPNRWWALAVPAWLVVGVGWIYVALASYNTGYLTLPLKSCENLVDACAAVAVVDRRNGKIVRGRARRVEEREGGKGGTRSNSLSLYQYGAEEEVDWRRLWSMGTDAVMDVPIGGVCEILYGDGRDREPWEMESNPGDTSGVQKGRMTHQRESAEF